MCFTWIASLALYYRLSRRYSTFNPEHSDDADDEMRWHLVECEKLTGISAELCGADGGAGSDAEKSEHSLTLRHDTSFSLIVF